MIYRGRQLRVTVGRTEARYELLEGEPLEIDHHEERVTLAAVGEPRDARAAAGAGAPAPGPAAGARAAARAAPRRLT